MKTGLFPFFWCYNLKVNIDTSSVHTAHSTISISACISFFCLPPFKPDGKCCCFPIKYHFEMMSSDFFCLIATFRVVTLLLAQVSVTWYFETEIIIVTLVTNHHSIERKFSASQRSEHICIHTHRTYNAHIVKTWHKYTYLVWFLVFFLSFSVSFLWLFRNRLQFVLVAHIFYAPHCQIIGVQIKLCRLLSKWSLCLMLAMVQFVQYVQETMITGAVNSEIVQPSWKIK